MMSSPSRCHDWRCQPCTRPHAHHLNHGQRDSVVPHDHTPLHALWYDLLHQVLKLMVGDNLKDVQLQQIVDKTIIYADKDGDGMVSFEEFCGVR